MKATGQYEDVLRGTPEFPLGFYRVDNTHPNYHMQLHWHVEYEMIHICTGSLTLFLDEETVRCDEGDCILLAGSILHGATPKHCIYECAVFDTRVLFSGVCQTVLGDANGYVKMDAGSEENEAALAFFGAIQENRSGKEFLILSALYRCMGLLQQKNQFQSSPVQSSKKIKQLKKALQMIETQYSSTITLPQMAKVCGMSPKYFCRFFKEMTHKTPVDYLNNYRVKRACEMLRQNQESITEIALSCGFNDLSYFIKTFKRYKGVSPKNYQKQIQNNES